MTTWLPRITTLVDDLSLPLTTTERYQRLLATIYDLIHCDAVVLLRLDGDYLIPLAVQGVSKDTLGRRFLIEEHPRFKQLLAHKKPLRFPSNSPLPDPYDGLIEGIQGQLHVHDCMGCALYCQGKLWGLLTMDALVAARFDHVDKDLLSLLASLTVATVEVADRIEQLTWQAKQAQQRAESFRLAMAPNYHEWIGESEVILALKKEIELIAPSDLTVLLLGETGVGKELAATAIHQASTRAQQPMVSINCAALPEHLIESELFGHIKGAFSGAVSDRAGKFEQANHGTLLLDEVGELPLTAQAKLLRVLQNGQLQRIGADKDIFVDVRIIAATNRDLAKEVKAGRFRADLYHRLSVYPLPIPPLRDRGNDILLLAGYFLELNRSRFGVRAIRLDSAAQAALLNYDWPGNVRELEHVITRAALKALHQHNRHTAPVELNQPIEPPILTLFVEDLHLDSSPVARLVLPLAERTQQNRENISLRDAQDQFLREYVAQTLAQHQGNLSAASQALQINRANLARLLKRLGMK